MIESSSFADMINRLKYDLRLLLREVFTQSNWRKHKKYVGQKYNKVKWKNRQDLTMNYEVEIFEGKQQTYLEKLFRIILENGTEIFNI